MGLRPIIKKSFGLKQKDRNVHGESVYVIKGGSTLVDNRWIFFNDIKIDVQTVVVNYMESLSRRIFNEINGVLYVLIVIDNKGKVQVVPSISYNKTSSGEVKVFEDISGKVPLLLVKLTQDGSSGLTGIRRVKPEDIEVYKGCGNYTTQGLQGETGPQGITGFSGITGIIGCTGPKGVKGLKGYTGIKGLDFKGETGPQGAVGSPVPWVTVLRKTDPVADFVGTPTSGNSPLTVNFNDLSTGDNIESWYWSFGDGTYSSETGPQHTYSAAGTYTVSLEIWNESGDSKNIKVDYITVEDLTFIQDVVDESTDGWQGSTEDSDSQVQNDTEFPT